MVKHNKLNALCENLHFSKCGKIGSDFLMAIKTNLVRNYSTAWSHMHIGRGFHKVDAWAVHEVCPCVHLGRMNEAQDETETKPRESCSSISTSLCS